MRDLDIARVTCFSPGVFPSPRRWWKVMKHITTCIWITVPSIKVWLSTLCSNCFEACSQQHTVSNLRDSIDQGPRMTCGIYKLGGLGQPAKYIEHAHTGGWAWLAFQNYVLQCRGIYTTGMFSYKVCILQRFALGTSDSCACIIYFACMDDPRFIMSNQIQSLIIANHIAFKCSTNWSQHCTSCTILTSFA